VATKTKTKNPASEPQEKVVPRLRTKYAQEVAPALREQFRYDNPMMIPTLEKVVINMGIGKATENKARLEHAARELGIIAGQKPVTTKARRSVAGFKLREGYPIGVCVTLRGARMWEFLDRLMSVAVPRIRDFRGLPNKLDGRGNYTMGLSEQSVFPEIHLDKVEFVQGMSITFVTSARTDEEGLSLLQRLGMPFRK
jgi:large subunit ribosomal protein L5